MELPLYKIVINMDDDMTGMTAVSLVDHPAIEVPFLRFDAEKQSFQLNDDKKIITGPAILADTPIYRNSPTRGQYYVIFTKETIRQIVEKYSKNQLFNIVNLQHNEDTFVNSCYMVESMIIDKERGICPNEFKDIPDGSWIVSYKVDDDSLWNEIKNGNHLNGFSIEILSEIELVETKATEEIKQNDSMNKFFKLAKMILKLTEIPTDKETLIVEGEIEVGKPAFIETEEGPVPAADGEYKLGDETVVVIAEGIVAEIRPVENEENETPAEEELEETPADEEAPAEEVDPKIAELEAKIAELEAVIEEKDAKIAELEGKIAEQEEKLKLSVDTPLTKMKQTNRENKALKYFS